ncbi:hypothetical protein SS50377_26623 [Spironucleus salmonicida]|uniref:Uncharacterized protein n=1 Tax=Spironucleus salmonicida TaxID=348837 RepID=V6LAI6_9EUKA|nr:hypothetical protein SS50377_26623 [Spironucleus salmonicida]|eukprot:EST41470.1 Hypothetical protein SS50377_19195 [Spironucleus salmonicida]
MVAANLTKQQQIGSLAESLILQSNNLDVQNNFVVTAQILTTQLRELTGNFYNQLSQIMRNRKYNNQLMALESYYSDYTSNMGTLSLDSALDIKFGAQMVNKVSVPITQLHCGTFKGKLFGVFSTNELTIQCTKLAECWKSHVLEVTK